MEREGQGCYEDTAAWVTDAVPQMRVPGQLCPDRVSEGGVLTLLGL